MKRKWLNTKKGLAWLRKEGGKLLQNLDVMLLRELGRRGEFGKHSYIKAEEADGEALIEVYAALRYFKTKRKQLKNRRPDKEVEELDTLCKENGWTMLKRARVYNKIRSHHKRWTTDDVGNIHRLKRHPDRR